MVRAEGGRPLSQEAATATVRTALQREYGSGSQPTDDTEQIEDGSMRASTWRVAFGDVRNWASDTVESAHEALSGDVVRIALALAGHKEETTDEEQFRLSEIGGRELHIREAFTALGERPQPPSDDDLDILARVALFSPGCISFRVVDRLADAADAAEVSESGIQVAAAALACGLRTLFNRAHVQRLLDASPDVGRY